MRGKDTAVSRVVAVCQVPREMLVLSSATVGKMLETQPREHNYAEYCNRSSVPGSACGQDGFQQSNLDAFHHTAKHLAGVDCLRTIRTAPAFPFTKHVRRDEFELVSSCVSRGWIDCRSRQWCRDGQCEHHLAKLWEEVATGGLCSVTYHASRADSIHRGLDRPSRFTSTSPASFEAFPSIRCVASLSRPLMRTCKNLIILVDFGLINQRSFTVNCIYVVLSSISA